MLTTEKRTISRTHNTDTAENWKREGGRERGREGGREGGRDGGREGGREGQREEGREEGRDGWRNGGREEGREEGMKRRRLVYAYNLDSIRVQPTSGGGFLNWDPN